MNTGAQPATHAEVRVQEPPCVAHCGLGCWKKRARCWRTCRRRRACHSVPLSDTQHNFIYCCISMTHTGSLTVWSHPENHPLLSKGPVPTLVASAEPDRSAPSCRGTGTTVLNAQAHASVRTCGAEPQLRASGGCASTSSTRRPCGRWLVPCSPSCHRLWPLCPGT